MYERFTNNARKALQLAVVQAQQFNHEYIGTEHLLLGMLDEQSSTAADVLRALYINYAIVRMEVEMLLERNPDIVTIGKLPWTPEAKKVIEYAMEESQRLGCSHVGTEHILLGLLRANVGMAAKVLAKIGLELNAVRLQVETNIAG